MPAGVQLAIVFVPWALCGMAAARARQRCESIALPGIAFTIWAVAIMALLATDLLGGDLLFG